MDLESARAKRFGVAADGQNQRSGSAVISATSNKNSPLHPLYQSKTTQQPPQRHHQNTVKTTATSPSAGSNSRTSNVDSFSEATMRVGWCSSLKKATAKRAELEAMMASMCVDQQCRVNRSCQHCNLRLRDASGMFNTVYSLYFAVLGINYTPGGIVGAPTANTQWLYGNTDGTATIVTSLTAPTVGTGQPLIQLTNGSGISALTPPGSLVMINGINDASSTNATTLAHLLNTLFIVSANSDSNTWTLTVLSVGRYRAQDYVQFEFYNNVGVSVPPLDSATMLPKLVRFTNVSACGDNTLAWAPTLVSNYVFVHPVFIDSVRKGRSRCDECFQSYGDGPCNDSCERCNRLEIGHVLDISFAKEKHIVHALKSAIDRHEKKLVNAGLIHYDEDALSNNTSAEGEMFVAPSGAILQVVGGSNKTGAAEFKSIDYESSLIHLLRSAAPIARSGAANSDGNFGSAQQQNQESASFTYGGQGNYVPFVVGNKARTQVRSELSVAEGRDYANRRKLRDDVLNYASKSLAKQVKSEVYNLVRSRSIGGLLYDAKRHLITRGPNSQPLVMSKKEMRHFSSTEASKCISRVLRSYM